MNIQTKQKQWTEEGYPNITEEEIQSYLDFYLPKMKGPFAKQRLLRKLTVNQLFDFLQLKVETTSQQQFDWHHIDDLF